MLISKSITITVFRAIIFLSILLVSKMAHAQKIMAKRSYSIVDHQDIQPPTTTAVGSGHESQLVSGQEIFDPTATFSAYPNPVQNIVQLSWKGHSIKRIELNDMNGRLVKLHYPKLANSDLEEFDLTNFKPGIYFATAYNLLGNSSTLKIIKK